MLLKEKEIPSWKGCSLEYAHFLPGVCVVSHLTYDHLDHLYWQKLLISFCASMVVQ